MYKKYRALVIILNTIMPSVQFLARPIKSNCISLRWRYRVRAAYNNAIFRILWRILDLISAIFEILQTPARSIPNKLLYVCLYEHTYIYVCVCKLPVRLWYYGLKYERHNRSLVIKKEFRLILVFYVERQLNFHAYVKWNSFWRRICKCKNPTVIIFKVSSKRFPIIVGT